MKKRMNRLAAIGLAVSMAVLTMSGCGNSEGAKETSQTAQSEKQEQTQPVNGETAHNTREAEGVSYPLNTDEKLTFGMVLSAEWSDRFSKWTDLPIGKAIQEETGVELDMVHVENNTAMNLLLASGELPDILLFNFQGNYSGGEIKAVDDGVIFPMENSFRRMRRITGGC